MRVYFSGISGTGIGPLAELAKDAGFDVLGSDLQRSAIADEINQKGIDCFYGAQDGDFLREKNAEEAIDWLVYTSALPKDHAELKVAKELGIRCSKRDEFIAEFCRQKQLKMIAIAGTHGKTTTTAILIWTMLKLSIPVSYLVGTTLGWAPSAKFDKVAEYFVYEADEYDRNFLSYHPYIGAITTVDYDHPDIYPTREDYQAAFRQFERQSQIVVKNTTIEPKITLVGGLRKQDANLAWIVIQKLEQNIKIDDGIEIINQFPGAGRRFEKIAKGVFSDYGHHPAEIKATVEMAEELKIRDSYAGLAIIYQPHQNTRQHEIYREYKEAFLGANKLFWLPTYLTRENPNLEILKPEFFISQLTNAEIGEAAEADELLAQKLRKLHANDWLIVLMTAGPADSWLRSVFAS